MMILGCHKKDENNTKNEPNVHEAINQFHSVSIHLELLCFKEIRVIENHNNCI